jgi:diguanylate cyclase
VTPELYEQLFTIEVLVWILPCVLVSVGIGFVIGRSYALRNLTGKLKQEQAAMVTALQSLVESTEQLTSDVDSHNTELASVGQTVCDMDVGNTFATVQRTLLGHIADVIESNRKLEDDLVVTRYRLEEQAQELDRTRREARIDSLSGVPNRKAFDEALAFMVAKFKRRNVAFSLMLLDVDHFKRINDTHGHQSGDRVVTLLGEKLKEQVRPSDFVGRFGGDEFAILFSGLDHHTSQRVAERIQQAVEQTNFDVGIGNARVAVTLSMGMADVRDNDTAETIFERADKALYRSKKCGRNQLNVWDDSFADSEQCSHDPVPAGH